MRRVLPWAIALAAAAFFLVPLFATLRFSLMMRRGEWSFDAYRAVFSEQSFGAVLGFSASVSALAIVLGAVLVVPTVYWVRLRLPALRPVIEFLSLLPLIIPPVVLVFGYLRLFGTGSILPLTMTETGTTILLAIGYVVLSLPYMFRAVDNGLATLDLKSLTEAAQSLGASQSRIIAQVIFPNLRGALLSGAFLTFSISLGEFVITSLLNRPGLGPYLVQTGQDYAYQPAALAILSFAFTWACMALMDHFAHTKPRAKG